MRKILVVLGLLSIAIYACNKQGQDDINSTSNNNDDKNTLSGSNLRREVVILESGIYVETDGEDYFFAI